MSFCPNCGKEIEGKVTFCPSCGFNLKGEQKSSSSTSSPGKGRITSGGGLNTRTYMIISVSGLGALAILSLILGDSIGFIIAAALCAVLYFLGMKKFEEGDKDAAKKIFLIVAVLTGVLGIAIVVMGIFFGAVDILVAIPIFMAWNEMEKS
jgi:hypothetical protein